MNQFTLLLVLLQYGPKVFSLLRELVGLIGDVRKLRREREAAGEEFDFPKQVEEEYEELKQKVRDQYEEYKKSKSVEGFKKLREDILERLKD